jgi:hypothetical protein
MDKMCKMQICIIIVISFYFTNQMYKISCMWLLKAYLLHPLVQVHHLQGEQNSSFKTDCQKWAII